MIYAFDDAAGEEFLTLKGEQHKYLIKVRRHTVGDELYFRNKEAIAKLYKYKIVSLEPRSATLELLNSEVTQPQGEGFHLAWCIIDPKSVEKVLASLCEMGVGRISFIICERSQKSFKIDFKRLERIVEASMQQSGRSSFMEFDTYNSIAAFLKEFPDTQIFDFSERRVGINEQINRALIGCEGGFSESERALFAAKSVFGLNTTNVLRSESAALAVVAKLTL